MSSVRTTAAVGAWLMAALALSLLTGLARSDLAWLWLGALYLVVPSQLAWQLTPLGRRVRVPVVLALIAGAAVGLVASWATPLSTAELRDVAADFVLPDGWDPTAARSFGGPLCLDACPTLERTWDVDRPAAAVAVDAVAVLRGAGFRTIVREEGGRAVIEARSGRVRADATVSPPGREPTKVSMLLTSTRR